MRSKSCQSTFSLASDYRMNVACVSNCTNCRLCLSCSKRGLISPFFLVQPHCRLSCIHSVNFDLLSLTECHKYLLTRKFESDLYWLLRLPISVSASCQHSTLEWLGGKQEVNHQLSTTQTNAALAVEVFLFQKCHRMSIFFLWGHFGPCSIRYLCGSWLPLREFQITALTPI